MSLCVQRVYIYEVKKGTGAMITAKNEVFIGYYHEKLLFTGEFNNLIFQVEG